MARHKRYFKKLPKHSYRRLIPPQQQIIQPKPTLPPYDPFLNPFGYQIPYEQPREDWQLIDPFIIQPTTQTGKGYQRPTHPDIPDIFTDQEEPFEEYIPEPPIPAQPTTSPLRDPVPPITLPDLPPFDPPQLDIPAPFPPDEPIESPIPDEPEPRDRDQPEDQDEPPQQCEQTFLETGQPCYGNVLQIQTRKRTSWPF